MDNDSKCIYDSPKVEVVNICLYQCILEGSTEPYSPPDQD